MRDTAIALRLRSDRLDELLQRAVAVANEPARSWLLDLINHGERAASVSKPNGKPPARRKGRGTD
jgi:hypothetical protein